MYRAYIAQKKYSVVIEEIRSGSPKEYLALRTLAEYLSSDSVKKCVFNQYIIIIDKFSVQEQNCGLFGTDDK